MRKHLGVLIVVSFLLGFSGGSHAAPVTFYFQGVVDQVTDGSNLLGGNVALGDTISGSVTYDSDPASAHVVTNSGVHTGYFYETPPYGMNVNIGSLNYYTVPESQYYGDFLLQVSDNETFVDKWLGSDNLVFWNYGTATNAHSVSGNLFMELDLVNMQGNIINDESPPATAPNSSDWPLKKFNIRYYPSGPGNHAAYEILATISFVGVGEFNSPPVAEAGEDQVVFSQVTLDGSGSYDPEGMPLIHQWSLQHRGDSTNSLTAEGVNPTISDLAPGFYDVTLTVTDPDGAIGIDTMLLAVAGQCAGWPQPNGLLALEKFKIVQKEKAGVTTTSMSGTATLPELSLGSAVQTRITIELFDVLGGCGDCVLSEEMTLPVTRSRNKLVIGE
jgi:hypothetical protein